MRSTKVVIFDWGSVLEVYGCVHMGTVEFYRDIARALGASVYNDEFEKNVKEYLSDWGCYGIVTDNSDKALDSIICKALNAIGVESTPRKISEFKKAFYIRSMQVPTNYELVDYAHSLKDRCKIGLLSNVTVLEKPKQDIDVCRSMFDYVWLSCDLGTLKPDREIYERVTKDLLSLGEFDIIFIDDNEANVKAAEERGWKVVHYKGDNNATIAAIEEFLGDD